MACVLNVGCGEELKSWAQRGKHVGAINVPKVPMPPATQEEVMLGAKWLSNCTHVACHLP